MSTVKKIVNSETSLGQIRLEKPKVGTVSLVSTPWSLFEVPTDVLLFMHSETTETTSRALCDPHSADLKVLLIAKFNRGQKYTEGTTVSSGSSS